MTTFDTVMATVGRSLQRSAERRASRVNARRAATHVGVQLWNLVLVLAGLGLFVYAAWLVSHPFGFAVGGVASFALRSLVTWGGSDART